MRPNKSPLLKPVMLRTGSWHKELSAPKHFYNTSFPARKEEPFDLLNILQTSFLRREKAYLSVMQDVALERRHKSE